MKKYIKILRISHYAKNGYIFFPIFFSGEINFHNIIYSFIAFVSFSMAASSIYIFNDIMDIEEDKLHPVKKYRPIPQGIVSIKVCYFIILLLLSISIFAACFLSVKLIIIISIYLIMNIFYSLKLKQIAIVDVSIISVGFVLRVLAGGVVCHIMVSKWLVIMVFLLSMFQAFSKRMDEIHRLKDQNTQMRKVMQGYNQEFLQVVTALLCGVLMVCYIMYVTSPELTARLGEYAYLTVLFVLLGLLRYLQICFVFKESGSPVKILIKDTFVKVCIFLWFCSFVFLIFFK